MVFVGKAVLVRFETLPMGNLFYFLKDGYNRTSLARSAPRRSYNLGQNKIKLQSLVIPPPKNRTQKSRIKRPNSHPWYGGRGGGGLYFPPILSNIVDRIFARCSAYSAAYCLIVAIIPVVESWWFTSRVLNTRHCPLETRDCWNHNKVLWPFYKPYLYLSRGKLNHIPGSCRRELIQSKCIALNRSAKMKICLAFLCCLAVASPFVLNLDEDVQWKAWKSYHGKMYATESEEAARKAIWRDNLRVRQSAKRCRNYHFSIRSNTY